MEDADRLGCYWSVDDCRWVRVRPRDAVEAGAVPAQRDDEAVEELVEA